MGANARHGNPCPDYVIANVSGIWLLEVEVSPSHENGGFRNRLSSPSPATVAQARGRFRNLVY